MPVDSVSANGTLAQTPGQRGARVNSQQFMQLLTTQLKNQNPFDPVADTEFLAQLAQFSQLEEVQAQRGDIADLATNLRANTNIQGLAQAANLIGKDVTYVDANGEERAGEVRGVKFANGSLQLEIDGGLVPMGHLLAIAG